MFRRTQDTEWSGSDFVYEAFTLFGQAFQLVQLSLPFVLTTSVLQPYKASFIVWAIPVSLAATQGIEFSFSSCNYLDVSVHCVFLLIAMYSQTSKYPLRYLGSPIRKSPDQSLLTAPRGVSSLVTSFIGS